MESIYLGIVIFLFLLAIFDLTVGVSNDAVNFLNSAIGAKAASFKAIQEMCEEQGEPFDSDPKEHNPDVFSMCLHDKRGKGRKTAMKRVYDKCMVGPDNYQEDLSVCTSCLK